jgi:aldehyde dehydrogenase (NAD+)
MGSKVMQEEIFGPILPILPYETLEDALVAVNSLPRPLALYLFARDKAVENRVLARTSSGDAMLNGVVAHVANTPLPFGGNGPSGIGKSHGYAGFQAFSHRRSVMKQSRWSTTGFFYPPYTKLSQKLSEIVSKWF